VILVWCLINLVDSCHLDCQYLVADLFCAYSRTSWQYHMYLGYLNVDLSIGLLTAR
jgi:hypothetical protein